MAIPYVEQTWTDSVSQTTAARMAYIEQGVEDAHKMPCVRCTHSANQAIVTAVSTALAFDSETGGFDTHSMHSGVTNNSRITCQHAGKYMIGGNVQWENGSVGLRLITIRLNGATSIADQGQTPASAVCRQNLSTIYDLAVNDYVELLARQDSGSNKNVEAAGNTSPIFWAVRVA